MKHKKETVYQTRIHELLKTAYPDYNWNKFKFTKFSPAYINYLLETPSEQKEFVDYLEELFNIKHSEDWKNITKKQLNTICTKLPLRDIISIIKKFHPEID